MISDEGKEYCGLTINVAEQYGSDLPMAYDVVLDGYARDLGAMLADTMMVSEGLPHVVAIGLSFFLYNAGVIGSDERDLLISEIEDNEFSGVADMIRESVHG